MEKFVKILSALPVVNVKPFAFTTPKPKNLDDDDAMASWFEARKVAKVTYEKENAIDPTKDCAVACAHLLASLGDANFLAIAEDAAKRAFALKGKTLIDAVSLREEIATAYQLGQGIPAHLKAVYEFAAMVDRGELETVATQKPAGDKLGLTDSARAAAFNVGNGGGIKYLKKGSEKESITQMQMLYVLAGLNDDGSEKEETPIPTPVPAKPAPLLTSAQIENAKRKASKASK